MSGTGKESPAVGEFVAKASGVQSHPLRRSLGLRGLEGLFPFL